MTGGGKAPRSGAIAAFLSFLFPGLGQAYLGKPRTALIFAVPAILLLAGFVITFTGRGAYRLLDPSVSLAVLVIAIVLGAWWILAVVHAWLNGRHTGVASVALVGVLVFLITAADVFGAAQLWRVRTAAQAIFSPDTFGEETPTPSPTSTPLAAGQLPDPQATPTQRPPDAGPSDGPTAEPTEFPIVPEFPEEDPTILPAPPPEFDIKQIDATGDGFLNVLLVGYDWEPGRSSGRTDPMVVVSVNSNTEEVLMFSFPRDTSYFKLFRGACTTAS